MIDNSTKHTHTLSIPHQKLGIQVNGRQGTTCNDHTSKSFKYGLYGKARVQARELYHRFVHSYFEDKQIVRELDPGNIVTMMTASKHSIG